MSILETLEISFAADLAGVTRQLDGLSVQLRGISGQALAMQGSMRSAGERLSAGLNAGFLSGAAGARSAGYQMSSGFASGIRSGRSAITSAVSSVVNSALKRMRSLLSIHSPSKVTLGFGEYFGDGFARGISGSVSSVVRAADGLGSAAVSGLRTASLPEMNASGDVSAQIQSAVDHALGNVNLVVPLTVDGMKLGEASIRGINAVTKSAGRVLLNI